MIPVDTPARRAICAMVVVHSDIYCVQRGVDQLPAPDRLHPSLGIFATPFISVG